MKIRRRVANPWEVWLYVSMDYSMLELCTLAQITYSLGFGTAMRDAINAGQDLHARLASRILGITYDEGIRLKKAGDPQFKAMRQTAKPVNFGKPGLMGPPKMVFTARKDGAYFCELADGWKGETGKGCRQHERVTTWGLPGSSRAIPPTCVRCLELAKTYSDLWYQEWFEMKDYHEFTVATARACEGGEPLESMGLGIRRLETSANAVSNHFFQNLAAQGAKHAAYLLSKEAYTDRSSILFNNYRTVVFVHDENFGEVREPVAHEVAWRACKVLKDGMQEFTPDVMISLEPALQRRWFKNAERVEDKNGRLKPWWPKDWAYAPDAELMREDTEA